MNLLADIQALLPSEARDWIQKRFTTDAETFSARSFFIAFSSAVRFCGKNPLQITSSQQHSFCNTHGAMPRLWRTDHTARICLLLQYARNNPSLLEQLLAAADLGETEAIAYALPFITNDQHYTQHAHALLRSNIQSVFEAIALDNIFPARYFDENGWNQMVLKSFFINSDTRYILASGQRHTPQLAAMLIDYTRERDAASRAINPQIWKFIAPSAQTYTEHLHAHTKNCTTTEQQALQLALSGCSEDTAWADIPPLDL